MVCDLEAIGYAVSNRFIAELKSLGKKTRTTSQVLIIVKHIKEDETPTFNASRTVDHSLFRIIPVSDRIPDDLYRHLIRASLFSGAAGDNAIMDAFSLRTWPFPLFHETLCKKCETMFPVSSDHCEEMVRRGVAAEFDTRICEETLRLLGTNGKVGSEHQRRYVPCIPTDEGLRFYREIICPYVLETFNYGRKLLEFHAVGQRVAEQQRLDALALTIPLS